MEEGKRKQATDFLLVCSMHGEVEVDEFQVAGGGGVVAGTKEG